MRADLLRQVRVAALAQARAATDAPTPASDAAAFEVHTAATPVAAGQVERAALAVLAPLQAMAPGDAGFTRGRWLAVTATRPAPSGAFWASTPPQWRESIRLLADDWSLQGPAAVAARVDALLPRTPAEWAIRTLQPLSPALALLGTDLRRTCARRIDPDVVPADRLQAAAADTRAEYVTWPTSAWRPAC